MIVIKKQGRERYCEAKLEKLDEVAEWAERYRKLWSEKFESLDHLLLKLKSKSRKRSKRK